MLAFVRQGNRSSGVFTLKPTKQSTRNGRPEMPFDIWQPNYRYRPKAVFCQLEVITRKRSFKVGYNM